MLEPVSTKSRARSPSSKAPLQTYTGPKARFCESRSRYPLRMNSSALELLQDTAECTDAPAASNKLAVHAQRIAIMPKDVAMFRWIREHSCLV